MVREIEAIEAPAERNCQAGWPRLSSKTCINLDSALRLEGAYLEDISVAQCRVCCTVHRESEPTALADH
jgi:hypothetical protein